MCEPPTLFNHDLPPLRRGQRVRVRAENDAGVIAQVWPGRDWYAVYTVPWRGPAHAPLPVYHRDELELLYECSFPNLHS